MHVRCPTTHGDLVEESYENKEEDNCEGGFTWPKRTTVHVEDMVRDAFGRADQIFDDVSSDGEPRNVENNNTEAEDQWNEVNMEYLVRESTAAIFEGSNVNCLQCAIVLFSLCSLYSVPNTFMDALFT